MKHKGNFSPLSYLLIALLLVCSDAVYAQTNISGIINTNTTWIKANSPYIITGGTILSDGVTLNVDPGVEIKLNNAVQVLIRGKLNFNGSAADSIHLMNNQTILQNPTFILDNSSTYKPKVNCRYISSTFGGFSVSTTNGVNDTILTIKRSYFNNAGYVDAPANGRNYYIFIDSCVYTNMGNVTGGGKVIFKNTRVTSNNYGLYIGFYSYSNEPSLIDHCYFSKYKDVAVVMNGTITNTEFEDNSSAVATMNYDSPLMQGNYFHDNGAGIATYYNMSNNPASISNNTLCNNISGIINRNATKVYAYNNCWCTNDSSAIAATVFDYWDDFSKGDVKFVPFIQNCTFSGYTGLTNFPKENNIFRMFPNPTSQILNVQVKSAFSESLLEVYNTEGKLIFNKDLHAFPAKEMNIQIDIKDWPQGLYLLKIQGPGSIQSSSFIKQ